MLQNINTYFSLIHEDKGHLGEHIVRKHLEACIPQKSAGSVTKPWDIPNAALNTDAASGMAKSSEPSSPGGWKERQNLFPAHSLAYHCACYRCTYMGLLLLEENKCEERRQEKQNKKGVRFQVTAWEQTSRLLMGKNIH